MAEFCLDCYNKIYKEKLTEDDAELTKYDDLCEGCGEYKRTVTGMKRITLINVLYEFAGWLAKLFFKK